ncbi:MAG: hypothetical protein V4678_04745, partial [Patescibacteria group bacterium]
MNEGESTKLSSQPAEKKSDVDGELAINHQMKGTLEEVAVQTAAEHQKEAAKTAEEELAEQLSHVAPVASAPSVHDIQKDLASEANELNEAAEQTQAPVESVLPPVEIQTPDADVPSMGGTLNATTEQAQHDKQHELDADRNKTILSHGGSKYIGDSQPSFQAPFSATTDDADKSEPEVVDIFAQSTQPTEPAASIAPPVFEPQVLASPPSETLEEIDRKNRRNDEADHSEARSAVELAYEATPLPVASSPVFTPEPQTEVAPTVEAAVQEQMAPVSPSPFGAPDVTLPPVPAPVDFSQLPPPPPLPSFPAPQGPLPPEQLGQIFGSPAPVSDLPPPAAPQSNDPNQFKIPGQ